MRQGGYLLCMLFPECEGLHHVDVVPVVAGDPREVCLPDLSQLLLSEPPRTGRAVVEMSVSCQGPLELVSYQTLECRSHQPSSYGALAEPSDEKVDVVDVLVDQLEPLHNEGGDEVGHLRELTDSAEAAELPELVVARQPVVSPPLDVESHQVHPEALVPALEEVVGHLLRHDVVVILTRLGGQSHQELVKLARGVHQLGVEESLRQRNSGLELPLVLDFLHQTEIKLDINIIWLMAASNSLQHSLDQTMSKSECCSSKGVDDSRINFGVVSVAVAVRQRQDVKFGHKVNAEDNGQKLVVSYVLKQNNKVQSQWTSQAPSQMSSTPSYLVTHISYLSS